MSPLTKRKIITNDPAPFKEKVRSVKNINPAWLDSVYIAPPVPTLPPPLAVQFVNEVLLKPSEVFIPK
jgi:hypothetical protein